jgi:hypothetical protein
MFLCFFEPGQEASPTGPEGEENQESMQGQKVQQ